MQKKLTFLTAERMQSPVSCMLQTVLLSMFPDSFINCTAGVPWDMQLPSKFSNQTKSHCPAQVACHLNQLSCWIWELLVTQTHIDQWLKHITATTERNVFKLYFLCAAAYVLHNTFHPKLILGTFTKLQKATICFIMSAYQSICPSAWNDSTLTGRIFTKFGIWEFFENPSRKFKFR